jgi:molybdate transport system substrate-binding protein
MSSLIARLGASVRTLAAVSTVSFGLLSAAVAPAQADTTLFAAASTTNAMTDVIAVYTAQTGKKVVPSFASSSTLAKQIEQGAPAQIFVSANTSWMDYLAKADMVVSDSVVDFLGNSLVMIAPKDGAVALTISKDMDLAAILGENRLSVGDPDHVPAGQYAKAALEFLGQWGAVEPKLARASDVRGALALVERGETPLGIVYSTDAAISDAVAVVATFPQESYKKITYPAALVKGADDDAKAFYTFMLSPAAKAIFAKYGFVTE